MASTILHSMTFSKKEAGKLGGLKTKQVFESLDSRRRAEYAENPVICKHCRHAHSYERRNNKFCGISCATSFNNKLREKKQFLCMSCGDILLGRSRKYCNNKCQNAYQRNQKLLSNTASIRTIKKFLIETRGYKCSKCGISEWMNESITLEMEHIDGDSSNNQLENLTLLCPNCHSQTSTFRAKNKGRGRHSRMQRYRDGKSY